MHNEKCATVFLSCCDEVELGVDLEARRVVRNEDSRKGLTGPGRLEVLMLAAWANQAGEST